MASVSATTQSSGLTALQALTQPAGTSATTGDSASSAKTAAQTQDQFLKMLVAQMKNQDPMNPLDNAQVTSQLAQISTVQGIEQLNSTMTKFSDQNSTTRAIDSAGLIGQNVLSAGSSFSRTADQTGATRVGVDLPAAADKVQVDLINASGTTVASRSFTNQPAGTLSFEWPASDSAGNKLAAGKYSMQVTAMTSGKPVTASALVAQTVAGVTQGSGAVGLMLANGTSITTGDIKGVFRP